MTHFPDMDEFMAKKAVVAEGNFADKILTRILAHQLHPDRESQLQLRREAGGAFNVDWFNEEMGCPIKIATKRSIQASAALILSSKGFTKTDLWKYYFEALGLFEPGTTVALIGIVGKNIGTYAIHNCWELPMVPGYNTIVRRAKSADKGLIMSPFNAFLHGLEEIWLRK